MSHDATPDERIEALEHQLEEHGHVHHDDVDAAIVAREMALENGDGPSPALGARIVARAWTDPEFKARLIADGTSTLAEYTPMTVPVAVMPVRRLRAAGSPVVVATSSRAIRYLSCSAWVRRPANSASMAFCSSSAVNAMPCTLVMGWICAGNRALSSIDS